jgi:hypothetical protein
MGALPKELRRELIVRVFPELRYGGDPDIERYFECRKDGKLGEALQIYNGPLRRRYPDDENRILLLKLYREADPRWRELQERLVLELADHIAAAFERNIDILLAPIARTDLGNAFRALNAVEALLRIIPVKGDDAEAFIDRYAGLARLIGYRDGEMGKAQELVREYLAMAKSEAPSEYDFIARSEAIEERRRTAEAARRSREPRRNGQAEESYDFVARSAANAANEAKRKEAEARSRFFDLSRISFSEVDRSRIEIPPSVTRREDKVLAYCWKYWELVTDPGFERLVFLYSRKYGTRHYDIFRAIKVGRARRFTDDEVLTAVSTLLSTSYSYSVSGDLYMQAMWRRLKARAEAERAAAAEAAAQRELAGKGRRAAAEPRREPRKPGAPAARLRPVRTVAPATALATRASAPAISPPPSRAGAAVTAHGPRLRTAALDRQPEAPRLTSRPRPERPAAPAEALAAEAVAPDQGGSAARLAIKPEALAQTKPAPQPRSAASRNPGSVPKASSGLRSLERGDAGQGATKPAQSLAPRPAPRPALLVQELSTRPGSISERIRKLSGKAYDVYKQLFLTRVREDIHRNLLANRTRAFRLFDDSANEAEDLIYAFMSAHYADPYMDWEGSEERRKVEALGYAVPSLDPIIEAWFRRL